MRSNLITPIILLIASIGLFFGFINQEYKNMQGLKSQVAVYAGALENAKELKARRTALEAKLSDLGEANRQALEKILPDSVDTVRMIMDINGIASSYGINISSIKVANPDSVQSASQAPSQNSPQEKEKDYDTTLFTFTMTTSYERFSPFLKSLEESLRIMDVTNITLKPASKEGASGYDFTVTAEAYWLK